MSKKSILDQLDMFDQPQEYPKSVKKKPSRREKREANAQQQNRMALKNIVPITDTQKAAFAAWNANKNLVLHGVAGSGKTFIAIYLALKAIEAGEYEKLIIVRSVVPTRDMGFLPGSMTEKIKVYETPYHSIFSQLYGRGDAYEIMKNKGVVSFTSTSFMRGDTLDNCIIVVDECSNLTFHESDTIITRMGDDSKIIFCGDEWQSDLRYQDERAGLKRFLSVLKAMSEFSTHEFTENDIVRSALVRSYIIQRLRQKV